MANSLIPELNGRQLTVDTALKQPSVLRNRIAKLADPQLLLDKFFSPYGGPIEGGGLLYSVIKATDFYLTSKNLEPRTPGTEYQVVEGVDPEPKLAKPEDWGGKFSILDEQIRRNNFSKLDQETTQLVNTIVAKLNDRALREIDAAVTPDNMIAFSGANWDDVVTVGPENTLTPNRNRPAAHIAQAQLEADLQELGVVHDLLIVHPNQHFALKVAYGDQLAAMLTSAGLTEGVFSSNRVEPGTAYAVKKGEAGTVGFEVPLTVDTWDDRSIRSKWVQGYAVPVLAVERPYAVKKLVGLGD